MSKRLLAAWTARVRALEAPPSVIEGLSAGGRLKISGRPAVMEAWFQHQLAERNSRMFRLDLEGWEPGSESLLPYAVFQATVRGLELPEWLADALELEDSVRVLSAARVAWILDLLHNPPAGLEQEGLQDLFDADDLPSLLTTIRQLIGPGTAAIWVPDGDLLPVSLSQALAKACTADHSWLWLDRHHGEPNDAVFFDWHPVLSDAAQSVSEAFDRAVADTSADLDSLLAAGGASKESIHRLREALALWALGDGSGPLEPILVAMGLGENDREELIDLLDDHLVLEPEAESTDAPGVLLDFQYSHPSFAEAVYQPAHGAWVDVLLHGRIETQKATAALHLAKAMAQHEGRGRALRTWWLHLARLGAGADPNTPVGAPIEPAEIEATALRMRWETMGADLGRWLEGADADQEPSVEQLWTLAGSPSLAAGSRLTFLDAWQRRADSEHALRRGDDQLLRAEILRHLERPTEALECLEALVGARDQVTPESAPERIRLVLAATHLGGTLLLECGETEAGLGILADCVELAAQTLAEDDAKHLTLVANYGRALMQGGRLRQAREVLERSLKMTQAARGDEHPSTGLARNNLAGLLMETGELEAAQEHLRQAMETFQKTLGLRSMELYGTLRNLVRVEEQLGRDTFELWQQLASLEEAVTGGRHPALVATWTRLAELRRERGDDDGARRLYERALELAVEAYYGDHPSIPVLRQALDALGSPQTN